MKYICKSSTCAIALSNAAFPASMNCPVCLQPLIEQQESAAISNEDELLIGSLPYVMLNMEK